MRIKHVLQSGRYGNLARVAINFHIQTGNPAELDAAVIYTRAAVCFARLADAPANIDTDTEGELYRSRHLID